MLPLPFHLLGAAWICYVTASSVRWHQNSVAPSSLSASVPMWLPPPLMPLPPSFKGFCDCSGLTWMISPPPHPAPHYTHRAPFSLWGSRDSNVDILGRGMWFALPQYVIILIGQMLSPSMVLSNRLQWGTKRLSSAQDAPNPLTKRCIIQCDTGFIGHKSRPLWEHGGGISSLLGAGRYIRKGFSME